MSTVPKLTYAKIGNKTKNKMEVSSELSQSQGGQKSEDLFSHMNQENLNYIKKQLKMKKNRSVHEQSRINDQQTKEQQQNNQASIPERQNLFNTFQPEAHISKQQQQFQQHQRKNSEEKPLAMDLPEDSDQSYQDKIIDPTQRPTKKLSTSQNNMENLKQSDRKGTDNSKMYHSVPYPDELGKKRVTSIEGYFGEAMSINLNQNHNQEAPHFIDSIDDYILEFHQSKNLKPTYIKEGSPQKQEKQGQTNTIPPLSLQNQINKGHRRQQSLLKLRQMKKSSDTFGGDPKNRFSVHSGEQRSSQLHDSYSIQMKIKQQKLRAIQLAQQIQKTRKLLDFKDQIIKGLQINNQLLKEEVMHMRVSQSIILNNNKTSEAIGPLDPREQLSQKPTRRINNQNLFQYEPYPSMNISNHARRDSGHHNANRYINSYRDRANKLRINDFGYQNDQAYEHQYIIKNSRMQTPQRESIQKLTRQYEQFLVKDKDRPNFKKTTSKYKHELF